MTQLASDTINTPSKSAAYLSVLGSVISLVLICGIVFSAMRVLTWISYPRPDDIFNNNDLWRALWTGFRFDLAIILRASLLGILLSICCLALPKSASLFAWRANRYWGGLILLIAIWASIINFVFIGFFNRPIDSFAYSGLHYGIAAVWPTIKSMDPFGLRLLSGIAVSLLILWVYRTVGKVIFTAGLAGPAKKLPFLIFIVGLSLVIIMILARGSVSKFPLSERHLIVSSKTAVNNLVPNGIVALYYGYKEFKESSKIVPALDSEGRELFTTFYGKPPSKQPLFPQFFTQTPRSAFLEQNRPNVVLNLVESMTNSLLLPAYNHDVDLAGQLRTHLNNDYYFSRFLPAHDDTQKSLVGLMVNTEYSAISYSSHQHIPLQTSAAKVFKKAGYKTVFVYAGFEGLSNRSNYLKTQGFDEFIGAHQLRERYPAMGSSAWGGEDQFVFDEASRQLMANNTQEQPLFIVTLTVTNHPPYTLPKGLDNVLASPPKHLHDRLQDLPAMSLDTYKYTNDQLGQFIATVKNSSLKANTIVAITGDHAIRGMSYNDAERLHQISVPFYLYLPQAYRPEVKPDLAQIASHKDIMPTLYNAALSNASYTNLGRDLISPKSDEPHHNFAYHAEYFVAEGIAYGEGNTGFAVTANFMVESTPVNPISSTASARAYPKVLDWITRFQLSQATNKQAE